LAGEGLRVVKGSGVGSEVVPVLLLDEGFHFKAVLTHPVVVLPVVEPSAAGPALSVVPVVLLVRHQVLSGSEVQRDDEGLNADRQVDLAVIFAAVSHADEGVDGGPAREVDVVGDRQEGADVVLVEMEENASPSRVDVRNIGQEGSWQVVPVGGSDLGVNHSGSGAATDRSACTGRKRRKGGRVGGGVDEGAGEGEVSKRKQEQDCGQLHLQ